MGVNRNTCAWIPMVPLDRIWTDADVYKHLNLTREDIELVENTKLNGYKDLYV
jgi:hypothetical protein